MRNTLLGLLVASALVPGCHTMERCGEDLLVVATAPVHLVTTPFSLATEDYGRDPVATAASFPLLFPLYLAGDALLTVISAGDAALTPFYAPFDLRPLRTYDFSGFPPEIRYRRASEVVGLVLVVPLVLALLIGEDSASDWMDEHDSGGTGP